MNTISVPIGAARSKLCKLINGLESGGRILLTSHGRPKAVLTSYHETAAPWRAERADDPKTYGDLQSPVMEDWQ